jgi:RNA polymerase sigma-70 factor (ECF subfamily)
MSRLHRGRKLLQRTLYNHALALGIVKGEERPGEAHDDSASQPARLADYRARKRGSA